MSEPILLEQVPTPAPGVEPSQELMQLQEKLRAKMNEVWSAVFQVLHEHNSVDVIVRRGGFTDKEKIEALLNELKVKYAAEPEPTGALWIKMRNGNSLMVEFDDKGKVVL